MNTQTLVKSFLDSHDPSEFPWDEWRPVNDAVLCFVIRESEQGKEVLLIHKKRGLGKGKINGPGGKLEVNEDFVDAAIRETKEEVGITPSNPKAMANLDFVFADGYSLSVRVFIATEHSGDATESDEATPFWCPLEDIPFERMWSDDRLWLGQVLSGASMSGRFVFDDDAMLWGEVEQLSSEEL